MSNEEKDYIYASDLLQDPYIRSMLSEEEIDELQDRDRDEPIYYDYHKKKHFLSFKYTQRDEYTHDNRLELYDDDGIDYRYQVHGKLGKGAFGDVYHCTDHKRNLQVAMKVVRNERRFHKQCKIEVSILELFNMHSKDTNSNYVINILKVFTYRDNVFLVFPNFGIDLYNYYKKNTIDEEDVKCFGKQIARGLEFIHAHDIIHMDLKPENILIRDKHLKIIDFGSSMVVDKDKEYFKNYIQSRYYRSPEVVFDLPITTMIDIWSYGCILYELVTKKPLFPARSCFDLGIFYIHVLGYPPKTMDKIYQDTGYFTKSKELKTYTVKRYGLIYPNNFEWSKITNISLVQLIRVCCLNWESHKRCTANEILNHPFYTYSKETDSDSDM